MKEKREEILADARKIIMGERQNHYGQPEDSFALIAQLWNAYLNGAAAHRPTDCPLIVPHDVPVLMDLMKTARLAANPGKRDNWVDKAGYMGCGWEVCEKGIEHAAKHGIATPWNPDQRPVDRPQGVRGRVRGVVVTAGPARTVNRPCPECSQQTLSTDGAIEWCEECSYCGPAPKTTGGDDDET